jgi:hypothetical protein
MSLSSILKPAVLAAAASLLLAMPSHAANKSFSNPSVKGKRLDWCKVWGDKCGKPAAQAFCWYQDMGKVLSFSMDEAISLPTRIISTGQICDTGCDSFKKIVCAPKDGEQVLFDDDGSGASATEEAGNGDPNVPDNSDSNGRPAGAEQDLGGTIKGDLSVVSLPAGFGDKIALFGKRGDGLWWRSGGGANTWDADWSQIGGGQIKYSPSCVTFNKSVWCFVVGLDDALWTVTSDKSGGWTGYQSLGGVITGSPSAVVATDAKGSPAIYVFVRNTSGSLSMKAYYKDPETDLYAWADWRGINKKFAGAPTCVAMGGAHVDCYARNEAGNTLEFPTVLTTGKTLNLGGETEKRPGVMVSSDHKQVRVMVRGMDGKLWHRKWKSGEGFAEWAPTDIDVAGQPQCKYEYDTKMYWCFDVKSNGAVRARRFEGKMPF